VWAGGAVDAEEAGVVFEGEFGIWRESGGVDANAVEGGARAERLELEAREGASLLWADFDGGFGEDGGGAWQWWWVDGFELDADFGGAEARGADFGENGDWGVFEGGEGGGEVSEGEVGGGEGLTENDGVDGWEVLGGKIGEIGGCAVGEEDDGGRFFGEPFLELGEGGGEGGRAFVEEEWGFLGEFAQGVAEGEGAEAELFFEGVAPLGGREPGLEELGAARGGAWGGRQAHAEGVIEEESDGVGALFGGEGEPLGFEPAEEEEAEAGEFEEESGRAPPWRHGEGPVGPEEEGRERSGEEGESGEGL
jgi:hypothetical protein